MRLLRKLGVNANGWDPHFDPEAKIVPADCVSLGYVLNVIESPQERLETLREAFELATKVLIVAVRVDQALSDAAKFSDGLLTKKGSFQKLFTQDEFKAYLRDALERQPHMASLGIAYIFKNPAVEAEYLAELSLYRPVSFREAVRAAFAKDRIAKRYLTLTRSLGRPPLSTEFRSFPVLLDRFGSIPRIERIALSLLNSDTLATAREERRVNILMYLAMLRLQGLTPPPIRMLSDDVQADIKMLWPSYKASIEAGVEFLFDLGRPGRIQEECRRATVGKKLPDSLYVHKSAEEQLSPLLRLMILAAQRIVGEVDYDLIKIALDGKRLSFLAYKDFEDVPHPTLRFSVRVFLPTASYELRNYTKSLNPPILHRKETFLDPLHPRYAEFEKLSATEDALGLLSRNDIGTRNGWESLLESRGLRIEGTEILGAGQRELSGNLDQT